MSVRMLVKLWNKALDKQKNHLYNHLYNLSLQYAQGGGYETRY